MAAPTELIDTRPMTWAFVTRPGDLGHDLIKDAIEQAFSQLGARIAQAKIATRGPPRACYHYQDGRGLTGFDLGFPIAASDADAARAAGLKVGATSAGLALKTMHRGPYQSLRETYLMLAEDMKARGHEPGGDIWEIYLNDPDAVAQDQLVTEINWPLERAA